MEIDHRTVSQKPIEAHFCTRHTIIIEKQQKGIPIQTSDVYPKNWTHIN